jgi:rhodanese-related sulfurtransferase
MRHKFLVAALGLFVLALFCGCATAPAGTKVNIDGGGFYRSISPEELVRMLRVKDFFLVNVHVPYAGEIEKTDALISYKDTEARIGDYPRDRSAKIVVYCLTNGMSSIVVRQLVRAGFDNIYMLDGGMTAWKKAGFALVDRRAGK